MPAWSATTTAALIENGVLVIGDGYRAKNSELGGDGIPFARGGNVNAGFDFSDADLVPPATLARVGAKRSQPGDVVFTSKGTVGRFARVTTDTPEFVYSPQLCFWRSTKQEVLDERFLYYWIQGPESMAQIRALKGQTDMADYVSLRDQRCMAMSIPPIAEQRRIASVLGALDDKIDGNRRLTAHLHQTAETLFSARYVDFVGVEDRESSPIGPIPRGWRVVPLSTAVEINPRVRIPKGEMRPFIEMAAVAPWAVRPGRLARREVAGGSRFEPGDTLMARITGCIEHGKGAFVDFVDEAGTGSTEFIVLRAKPPLTPEAVFFLSRWEKLRQHAIANMTGSSGRQRVAVSCFDDFHIVVPPDERAAADVAGFLATAMRRSLALWRETMTLTRIRDELLPKLVSGELRVPPGSEPTERAA